MRIYISPVPRPGVGWWSADDGPLPAAAGQRKHREGSCSHLRNCILPPFTILKDDDNTRSAIIFALYDTEGDNYVSLSRRFPIRRVRSWIPQRRVQPRKLSELIRFCSIDATQQRRHVVNKALACLASLGELQKHVNAMGRGLHHVPDSPSCACISTLTFQHGICRACIHMQH